jgi:hypothetical protein
MAWHRTITNNLWLKVFSLVLATLIYFVIKPDMITESKVADNPLHPDVDRSFQIPVVLMTSAKNAQALQVDPTEVTVVVNGDPATVYKLLPQEIEVTVRLLNVQNPQGSFRVDVAAPRQVTVKQVWPAHVLVRAATNGLPQLDL